jgi:hypothetical protein
VAPAAVKLRREDARCRAERSESPLRGLGRIGPAAGSTRNLARKRSQEAKRPADRIGVKASVVRGSTIGRRLAMTVVALAPAQRIERSFV